MMRTDDLVSLMVASQLPVDSGFLARATTFAAAAATLLTLMLILATLGPRPDLVTPSAMAAVLGKAALGVAVATGALVAFSHSLRPGVRPSRAGGLVTFAAGLAMAVLALAALAKAPAAEWTGLVFGRDWLACLIAVPLYAMAPLAFMTFVARRGAPVEPRRTGMLAGLASGGLAVIAYSVHCREDAAPFIAAWYPLAIATTTLVGALVVPRLARW